MDLPLDNFYKHKGMADGHLNKCKECVKKRVNNHRELNIESIRNYDVLRANFPNRKSLNLATIKRRQQEVPGYQKAHSAVARAIKSGTLVRSSVCQVCGANGKTEGHHNDYQETLKVLWLCVRCHRSYHCGKNSKSDRVRTIVDVLLSIKNEVVE